ncbi:hypothetical protein D3C80_1819100 [compost metagenome]
MLDRDVRQLQGVIELGGVEQPDHHLHQDAVLQLQARLQIALDVLLVFRQEFGALEVLLAGEVRDRLQTGQILVQTGLHQLQVLASIRRAA